jgi:hypothetical protein
MGQAHWHLWLNGWKEQPCIQCGGSFRYRVRKEVTARGDNNTSAERHAWMRMELEAHKYAPIRPCPHCGFVQPDMICRGRKPWLVGLLLVGVFGGMGLPGLYGETKFGEFLLLPIVGIAFATLLWGILTAVLFWWPNRSLKANLSRSKLLVEQGELQATSPPKGEPRSPDWMFLHGMDRRQLRGVALGLVLILIAALPLLVPLVFGWPLQWGVWPPSVGPGDTAVVRVRSLYHKGTPAGDWSGTVVARIKDAEDPALIGQVLQAECLGSANSSQKLTTPKTGKMLNTSAEVAFIVPNDPSLAGQRLTVELDLDLVWIETTGLTAQKRQANEIQRVDLQLAPAGVAIWHRWLLRTAIVPGVVLPIVLLYLGVRAMRYARLATAGKMVPISEPLRDDSASEESRPKDGIQAGPPPLRPPDDPVTIQPEK